VQFFTQLAATVNVEAQDDDDDEEFLNRLQGPEWRFRNVAIVSVYSPPDAALLEQSFGTVWSCKHQGEQGLHVVEIEQIQAVVAVIPHRPTLPSGVTEDRFFVIERTGLDVSTTGVFFEENNDNSDSDDEEG
jgi:hypothetical protein